MPEASTIRVIAHPTDLQPGSEEVFAHALALALATGATLHTVHARIPGEAAAVPMHDAKALLSRWGKEAALRYEARVLECCEDPVDTLLHDLRPLNPDLIVAGRRHLPTRRLLHRNVGTALARNLRKPALFLPQGAPGFVDADTGALHLHRILVPAEGPTEVAVALEPLAEILAAAGHPEVDVVLFHVGDGSVLDAIDPRPIAGATYHRKHRSGPLEATILREADEMNADLVVMATHPRHGLFEQLRGSHTEHVSGKTTHPVLSVPLEEAGVGAG